ncbi:MAG: alanine racemase, partial [Burkholderiaceae bacterium]
SAALIDCPAARADWVRPGIMLYGATPFADRDARALGLSPAMRLEGSVIAIRDLARGDAYGYGSTFVADRPIRLGIVDCGYADGYPRHAPTGTPVAVAGMATRTIGRVSMDMLAVDLTPVPSVAVGSSVELFGARIPVDAVAHAAGTIGYELLCAVAPRVRRAVSDRRFDDDGTRDGDAAARSGVGTGGR